MNKELALELKDNEWALTTIDHDRMIVRAIVVDDEENYYFARINREIPVLKRARQIIANINK